MTICTQMSTFKHYSMTELEKKGIESSIRFIEKFFLWKHLFST